MADRQISPEEYEKLVRQNCPFCKIADGSIPAKKIYEDPKTLAFLDINPANPGHTLVAPKKHYAVLPQMSDSDISHLFKVVKRLAGAIFEVVQSATPDKPIGVNVLQNNGAAAGQQVPHVHIHIIPRFEGDGVIPPWKPRKIDDKQMDQLQSAFSEAMKKMPLSEAKPKEIEMPARKTEETKEKEGKEKPKARRPRSP